MWNRISQVAGFSTDTPEDEHVQEEIADSEQMEEPVEQQRLEIEQLKILLRENEEQGKEKDKQLAELSSKFKRFQIQSKAKIASLTNQLEEKAPKKEDADFDDASSSDSSDCSTRGKIILLRKQLENSKKQLGKKETENQDIVKRYETRIKDLELQLNERKNESVESVAEQADNSDKNPQQGSDIQEMYAQMVYKDSKILELNNRILELERNVLDLQEHVREKDEVLQSRNLAVQLMSADMSRKGKSVVDELEETRSQMKLMQSNFADIEHQWKLEAELLKAEMTTAKEDFVNQIASKEALIADLESSLKKVESVRYELATKNAELQKKIVLVEERSDQKQGKRYERLEQELNTLRGSLEKEKAQSAELQKTIDDLSNQSESKVFKARVKERTKLKALERELKELKSLKEQKAEEVTKLQQQVALLEEEKGTLQLRLIDMDEQISTQENLKSKNDELSEALIVNKDKVNFLEELVKRLEEEREMLTEQVSEQEKSKTKLKACLEEVEKKNLLLSQDLEELIMSSDDLKNHVSNLEKNIEELTSRNQELSEEITAQKEEKVSMGMKIIELEEIHENDEKQKEELQQKVDEMNNTFKGSAEQKLLEEKFSLETKCAELQEFINSANMFRESQLQQVESLTSELEKNKMTLTETSKQNVDYNNKISGLTSQLEELRVMCDEKKDQCASLTETVTELQNSLNTVLSIVRCESVSDFQTLWAKQDQEFKEFAQDKERLKERLMELEISLQAKEHEVVSLSEEVNDLQQQLEHQEHSFKGEINVLNELLRQESEVRNHLEKAAVEKDKIIVTLKKTLKENEKSMMTLKESAQSQFHFQSQVVEERDLVKKQVDELTKKLFSENEKTKANISSLLEQISDLESEVSRLSDQLLEHVKIEDGLKNELLSLKEEHENSIQECSRIEMLYQNMCKEKDSVSVSFQEELSSLNRDFLEEKNKLEELYNETVEKYEIEAEVANRNYSQNIELERTISEVETEKEELRQELLRKVENIRQLSESVECLEKQLNETNSELVVVKSKSERFTEELNASQKQIAQLKENVSTSQLSAKEMKDHQKSLLEHNLKLSEENKKLEDLHNSLLQQNIQLEGENKKLAAELTSVDSTLKGSLQEAAELRNQCKDLCDQVGALSSEIASLKIEVSEHATLKVKFEDLLSESNNQKSELEKLLLSKQMISEERNATESSLDSLKTMIKSKEQELEALKLELVKTSDDKIQYQTDNEKLKLTIESTNSLLDEQKMLNDSLLQELEAVRESSQHSDTLTFELSLAKKKLEKSIEDVKSQIVELQSQNSECETEITSLKATIQTCKDVVSELCNMDTSSSIEDTLRKVVHECKLFDEFKKHCSNIMEMLPDEDSMSASPLKPDDADSILQYFNNARLKIDCLKSQLSNSRLRIEQLQCEEKKLSSQNEEISDSYSKMEKEYYHLKHLFDNLHEEHQAFLLSLNCLPSQVASIEDATSQHLQTIFSKLDSLNYALMKLSLSKEQIQQLYLSHREHNRILKDKTTAHEQELENLRLSSNSYSDMLTQNVHALKEDIAGKECLIRTLHDEITSSSEVISSLKSELKSLCNRNEQLTAQVSQNKENYQNNIMNLKSKFKNSSASMALLKEQLSELKNNHRNLCKEQVNDFTNISLTVGQIRNEIEPLYSTLMKMNEENILLNTSLSTCSVQSEELKQQNILLQGKLKNAKEAINATEDDNSRLVQQQQLQIATLNSDIESLKLDMDKCASEKNNMEKELDTLKSAEKHSSHKYDILKELVQTASDAMDNVVHVEFLDSSFEFSNSDSSNLDDDFSTLVSCFQDKLVRNLKDKKQLSNEISSLQNEIILLNKKIKEANDNSLSLEDQIDVLHVQRKMLNSKLQFFEDFIENKNKNVCERLVQTDPIRMNVEQLPIPSTSERAEESLQQSSATETIGLIQGENERLKEEVQSRKYRIDSMTVKLKDCKHEIDRLNAEVVTLTSDNLKLNANVSELQKMLSAANNERRKLHADIQASEEKRKTTEEQLRSDINRLYATEGQLNGEISELQALCRRKEKDVSQHEDSSRLLRLKLEENYDRVTSLEASCRDLQVKYEEAVSEREQLTTKLQNLQEQTTMLMSDNETYQSVVEKLNHSNAALKNDVKKLNETRYLDIEKVKKQYGAEAEAQLNLVKINLSQNESLKAELQCKYDDMVSNCSSLTEQLEVSQQACKNQRKEIFSLKKALEQLTSEKSTTSKVDVSIQHAPWDSDVGTASEASQTDIDITSDDSESLRMQVAHVNEELQLAHNTIQQWRDAEKRWKSEFQNMELFYKKSVAELQGKLATIPETPPAGARDQLEIELQQALSSLHKKSIRCEELNVEVSKLIEERNSLKLKLSQLHQVQFQQQEVQKENIALQRSSEVPLDTVKIDMTSESSRDSQLQSEIATLHQRLVEAERTCHELRKANEALDSSLAVEREQRQLVEEELGYAQRQLLPMEKGAKNEYRLLLEDFDEPEMLVERNFSITREVKSHAYKFRRWLRGRRSFLHRSCQRKKYSEILYIFYICAIHLWLLLCLVKHS